LSASILPGFSHALAYNWRGDNQGPPESVDEVKAAFNKVRKDFPGASVIASTLDAFATELETVKNKLEVFTGEIGDSWIWGVGSDPIKTQRMRAINRQRSRNLPNTELKQTTEPALYNMSRLLIKASEHTWGRSYGPFGNYQKTNWSNEDFHKNRLQGVNYVREFEEEWRSQMYFAVDLPIAALDSSSKSSKKLRENIVQEFEELVPDVNPEHDNLTKVDPAEVMLRLGGWCDFGVDAATGAVTTLVDHGSLGEKVVWASASNPLVLQRYQTLTECDYAAWREEYLIEDCDWEYGKPEQDSGDWESEHQLLPPKVTGLWFCNETRKCAVPEVLMQLHFKESLHKNYGAPSMAWVRFTFDSGSSDVDRGVVFSVTYINKTNTRLGEAMFVTMNPPPGEESNWWAIDKHDQWVSPLDVIDGAPKGLHGLTSGVKFARKTPHAEHHIFFESKDAAMVAFDSPNPFPTPIHGNPNLSEGASFLLWNNIWNTNYVFWWPYNVPQNQTTDHIVFRFAIRFLTTSPDPVLDGEIVSDSKPQLVSSIRRSIVLTFGAFYRFLNSFVELVHFPW